MKGIITPKLANDLVLSKYGKRFHLTLVGSVAKSGRSYNDMDVVISYAGPEEIENFISTLLADNWTWYSTGTGGCCPNVGRLLKMIGPYGVILDLYKKHSNHDVFI